MTRIQLELPEERLHELERDFSRRGRRLTVTGLEQHQAVSAHPLAARWNLTLQPEVV